MSDITVEQNKVIAEFMGFSFDAQKKDGAPFYKQSIRGGWESRSYCNPVYNSDWNQLMAVVEKIESITTHDGRGEVNYIVTIEEKYCVISVGGEETVAEYQDNEATKIEIVHHAVYDFIVKYQSINTSK